MDSGDAVHLPVHVATMAQSVERRLGKAEVTGSIPVSSLRGRGYSQELYPFSVCEYQVKILN